MTKIQDLPEDFVSRTPLERIKRILRDRPVHGAYAHRDDWVRDKLLYSNKPEYIEAGIELFPGDLDFTCRAQRIASGHSAKFTCSFILKLIEDGKYPWLIRALIQEAVLRGANFEDTKDIKDFWTKLRREPLGLLPLYDRKPTQLNSPPGRDPLGWLPLYAAEIERCAPLYYYDEGKDCGKFSGSSLLQVAYQYANGQPISEQSPASTKRSGEDEPIEFATMQFEQEGAIRCVEQWHGADSNNYEAKLFRCSRVMLNRDVTPENLLKLKLECLAGLGADDIDIYATAPEHVFAKVFQAAQFGGANSFGLKGAEGRLAAWQTLRALCGAQPDCDFAEACALAMLCSWFFLYIRESETMWFFNQGYDFAICCLRPDGHHIAILAARDMP